ncbi:MAG: excinuclease ABC subunit UvrA [Gemmatimonadales bacterium]|jgi:excinuclease ABC subunit A
MPRSIVVRGARQHNLKGVDLEIPHRSMTVVTGPSGSGKSSLAFDTVYAEGQRRYVESLSTYAKQFLERMPKPNIDRIDGICPSVAIDQRNAIRSSRSTVGTVTEVYDYLRLLWARIGKTICPDCGEPVLPDSPTTAANEVLAAAASELAYVAYPMPVPVATAAADVAENLRAEGFVRVLVDGKEVHLDDPERSEAEVAAALSAGSEMFVVADRLRLEDDDRERLTSALAAAFAEGQGHAVVLVVERGDDSGLAITRRFSFSERYQCDSCGREFTEPTPLLFSFNHPTGACETCNGFGATLEYDESLIVPDPDRGLADGALDPWTKPRYKKERARLMEFAKGRDINPHTPWRELPEDVRHDLLHGADDTEGVLPFLRDRERKRYKQYIRVFLRGYQLPVTCPDCGGARLSPEALAVQIDGRTIAEVSALMIDELTAWIEALAPKLSPFEGGVSATVREEITDRLRFLSSVGLGYLTLDRQARSLSGGEMQRIRLAGSLGSRLVDTLYVLDEPTIGLHARDVEQFIGVLESLRDRGNTLLVVEHEEAVLAAADRIVELGPAAGEKGGEVVFEGTYEGLLAADTTTGEALKQAVESGRKRKPRQPRGHAWLTLEGATLHNVKDVDLEIPVGCLTVVTGVSGSGKSTLVHDVLYHALESRLSGEHSARRHLGEEVGSFERLDGAERFDEVVLVDQSPIGRTPRSNPVTYIKAYGEIRKLFAELPESRRRGYEPGHFSFNVKGGRCEACKGAGEETVEMVFLADVSVPCEICGGTRFKPEILEVKHRGLNIADVLELTVDEAIRFFIRQDRLGQALWQLQRVGLGYLRLGQAATTLSGGEAQRLKIARELAQSGGAEGNIYILDEPTVGLGAGEVRKLVDVLDQLVEAGGTIVVIEHNLDLVAAADWIVDLGPGAADEGGRIVAAGPPPAIMESEASHTGRFLRRRAEREAGEPVAVGGAA